MPSPMVFVESTANPKTRKMGVSLAKRISVGSARLYLTGPEMCYAAILGNQSPEMSKPSGKQLLGDITDS